MTEKPKTDGPVRTDKPVTDGPQPTRGPKPTAIPRKTANGTILGIGKLLFLNKYFMDLRALILFRNKSLLLHHYLLSYINWWRVN